MDVADLRAPPPAGAPTDGELITAHRAGDARALEALIRRYQAPIFRLFFRATGSQADAEDLTQKAFLKALDRLPRLRKPDAFRGWLFTIALNLTRNRYRSRARWRSAGEGPLEEAPDDGASAEDLLERRRRLERVERAIARLPRLQREVVRLRLHAELPFRAIAEVLGSSEASCKVSYHHALEKLRTALEETP